MPPPARRCVAAQHCSSVIERQQRLRIAMPAAGENELLPMPDRATSAEAVLSPSPVPCGTRSGCRNLLRNSQLKDTRQSSRSNTRDCPYTPCTYTSYLLQAAPVRLASGFTCALLDVPSSLHFKVPLHIVDQLRNGRVWTLITVCH